MAIDVFDGDFDWLSNFYYHEPDKTVEHYYQAAKTFSRDWMELIFNADTPGKAKRLGNQAPLRKDWKEVKVPIMISYVRPKFELADLRIKLIDTYPHDLIEGNTWHDNFWGNCTCPKCRNIKGLNMLGFIHMTVRMEIITEMKMAKL